MSWPGLPGSYLLFQPSLGLAFCFLALLFLTRALLLTAPSQEPVQTVPTPQSVESFRPEATHIGKSIAIKGEISGSENVYVAGELPL